jgi:hypothetical protein
MMMQMLEAGGIPVLTDGIRVPDEDNPRGYFEFEPVKRTKEDASWVEQARGKVVKMVSMLLFDLPPRERYRVIFMTRDMDEMLASQAKMLARQGPAPSGAENAAMADLYRKHLAKVRDWLARQPNFQVIYVSFNDVLKDPARCVADVVRFLDGAVDAAAMAELVDRTLYRNVRG